MNNPVLERRLFNDVKYYEWLCTSVGANRPPYTNYLMLLQTLHKKNYIWFVPMDANRYSDGFHLRLKFADQNDYVIPTTGDDTLYSCSVLEVLSALSIRIDSEITGEPGLVYPEKWFWIMMDNMGLTHYDDEHFDVNEVNRIVDIWLERRFGSDGMGSPFPLIHPFEDQRQIELWQQMQNYVNERC